MATHSSTLAWKIPWMEESDRLQSMGSLRVGHDWTTSLHALEKETATHSSVLAWRIPRTGEPGGLPSMGSHRVGHDWSDLAAAAAVMLSILIYILEVWGYKYYWQGYLPQILYSLVEKLGQAKFMNQSSLVSTFLKMRSLRDINDEIK